MKEDKITYLVGNQTPKAIAIEPYSEIVCEYLDELSRTLRSNSMLKNYPDVASLAFWCRKANIMQLKQKFVFTKTSLMKKKVFTTKTAA